MVGARDRRDRARRTGPPPVGHPLGPAVRVQPRRALALRAARRRLLPRGHARPRLPAQPVRADRVDRARPAGVAPLPRRGRADVAGGSRRDLDGRPRGLRAARGRGRRAAVRRRPAAAARPLGGTARGADPGHGVPARALRAPRAQRRALARLHRAGADRRRRHPAHGTAARVRAGRGGARARGRLQVQRGLPGAAARRRRAAPARRPRPGAARAAAAIGGARARARRRRGPRGVRGVRPLRAARAALLPLAAGPPVGLHGGRPAARGDRALGPPLLRLVAAVGLRGRAPGARGWRARRGSSCATGARRSC